MKRFSLGLFVFAFSVFLPTSNALAATTTEALMKAFQSYVTVLAIPTNNQVVAEPVVTPPVADSTSSPQAQFPSVNLGQSPHSTSSGQAIVYVTPQPSINEATLLSALRNLLSKKEIADKLRGSQGAQGIQGLTGPQGASATVASNPISYLPVRISNPDPSVNFSGGASANIANLSSNVLTATTSNITTLNVAGTSTLAGSLSVAGNTTVTGTLNVTGAVSLPGLTVTTATLPLIIGSTSANGTLTLEGNNTTGNTSTNPNLIFKVGNNAGTTAMTILNSGNVGIGTSTPASKLHVAGVVRVNELEFGAVGAVHGQSRFKISEIGDVLYQADKRFTVVGGTASMFSGQFDTASALPLSTANVISISMANQSGVPANGFTYPQGGIYISFYSATNSYSSISARIKHINPNTSVSTWMDLPTPTDLATSSSYKVIKFAVPSNNYLTDIELTITTDASNPVWVSSINYLMDRWGQEAELPYVSKYLSSNSVFGTFNVKTNTGTSNVSLSGTGNSYLAASTGNVGIGTTSPTGTLHIVGTGMSGNSATENFVRVTGTLPSSPTTTMTGIDFSITSAGSANVFNIANKTWLLPGYTGNHFTIGSWIRNEAASTGQALWGGGAGNYGTIQQAINTVVGGIGHNVGTWSMGYGSSVLNVGSISNAIHSAGSPALNVGAVGRALNATVNVGGFFTLGGSATPAFSESAALIADNVATTSKIFIARDNGTEVFGISDGGNVGIGTTSPAQKLDVNGSAQVYDQTATTGATSFIVRNGAGQGVTKLINLQNNSGTTMSYFDGSGTLNLSATAALLAINNNGAADISIGSAAQNVTAGPADSLGIKSGAQILFATGGVTERMRIDSSGNVGIGTTSPNEKLHIFGNIKSENGTANQYTRLTDTAIQFSRTSDGTYPNSISGGGGNTLTYTSRSGQVFVDNAVQGLKMVEGSGAVKVLVGTETPSSASSLFGVYGNAAIGAGYYLTAAPTNGAIIEGNVGIGTASPGARLHSLSATEQLRLGYDASNYNSFTVGSTGSLAIAAVGTNPNITLTPGGTGRSVISAINATLTTTYGGSALAVTALDNRTVAIGSDSNGYPALKFGEAGSPENNGRIYGQSGGLEVVTGSGPVRFYGNLEFGYPSSLTLSTAGNILFSGTTAKSASMDRHTTADTAGNTLTVQAGGATSGAMNKAGGDLNIKSGISTGTGISALRFFTATAGSTGISDNAPTEKMTILGSGNVGIGTTSPDYKLDIETDVASYVANFFNDGNLATRSGILIQGGLDDHTAAGPSTLIGFQDGDGGAVGSITFGSSATAYNTTSDQRLKNLVNENTTSSLNILNQIKIHDFTWKDDANHNLYTGVFAQELYNVYPHAITKPINDADNWMVDYSKLTPVMIASIQELDLNLNGIAGTITPLAGSSNESFVNSFFSNIFAKVDNWMADRANGIKDFFAERVHTKQICVEKADGTEFCVDGDELEAMAGGAQTSTDSASSPQASSGSSSGGGGSSTPVSDPAPVVDPVTDPAPATDPTPTSDPQPSAENPTSDPSPISDPAPSPTPDPAPVSDPAPVPDPTPTPTP